MEIDPEIFEQKVNMLREYITRAKHLQQTIEDEDDLCKVVKCLIGLGHLSNGYSEIAEFLRNPKKSTFYFRENSKRCVDGIYRNVRSRKNPIAQGFLEERGSVRTPPKISETEYLEMIRKMERKYEIEDSGESDGGREWERNF